MAVTYQTEGVKMPDIKKRETTEWIKAVAASYGKRLGEIAYIFCSDEKILEVNRQYLQHDYYTDIITFDYCEGDRLSGDLFISLDTIRTNAEQFGASYEDELHRVIITEFFTCAASTIKAPENGRLWKLRRIKHWGCCDKRSLLSIRTLLFNSPFIKKKPRHNHYAEALH